MAQSRGDELLKEIPHLNFAIGTDQIHMLPSVVKDIVEGKKNKIFLNERCDADAPGIDAHRVDEKTNQYSAFISIMRGCNRYCSYCIVPFVRGPEKSRSMQGVVDEAKMLVSKGIKEIMLLGQNVAAYGMGKGIPDVNASSPFADLLRNLNEIDGLKRIRFTSPHPAFFNHDLIRAIAELDKVCKNVHLPLQSGSNRILKLMNRPYSAERYRDIVSELKMAIPKITFSTDIIVGFPTETENEFELTRQMMRDVGFDNAFIFKYSPRRGTNSEKMSDDVPQEEKERRNQVLLNELEQYLICHNRSLIGKVFEILVDGPSKRNTLRWCGRTDGFKLVVFEPTGTLRPGDSIYVKINRSTPMTLYGEQIRV